MVLEGREKLFDWKRSTKRLGTDGRSSGKVGLSAVPIFA